MIDMSKYEHLSVMNYVAEIKLRMGNIIGNILEIGELYVESCRKYSNAKKVFKEAFPDIRETTWEKFAMVGKHKISASAFFLNYSFACRLASKKVPLSIQEKLISSAGVQVYRKKTKTVECVPFAEFTPEDEEVVFDYKNGRVRDSKEQKVFAEKIRSRRIAAEYEVTQEGLRVNRKCFIEWRKLEALLGERR